jgi:hypothetical protein
MATLPYGFRGPFGAGCRVFLAEIAVSSKVWHAQTGAELLTVKGHPVPVSSVTFSADGHRLASGCGDGTIKILGRHAAAGEALIARRTEAHAGGGSGPG